LLQHNRHTGVHRAALPAQAVVSPTGQRAAPAKTATILRMESRRDTDSANDFDISSRRSMIDTFFRSSSRNV
jgi:hypothetical protein